MASDRSGPCLKTIGLESLSERAPGTILGFSKLGIDTLEVLQAAGTKWNFLPYRPGLVGGHCIGVDPYYLTHKAQEVDYHPEVILADRRINDSMASHVAVETTKLILRKILPVLGSKVLLLGPTFKENCPDVRNTKVVDIIKALRGYNAQVDMYDPWIDINEAEHEHGLQCMARAPAPGQYAANSTYGDHPALPKVEENIGKPLSPYAVTKYVNEMYADVFARSYGFDTIGLRYFNVFGQRQGPNGAYAAVIPKLTAALLKGDPVYFNGDGETRRDFTYVANAIQANLLAATATSPETRNQVNNVAVGDRTTLNQLFFALRDSLKQIVKQTEVQASIANAQPIYREFRAGDVRHSMADIGKAGYRLSLS